MTPQQRDRLVGALVLLSIAAVALPMLFDGAGIERRAVADFPDAAAIAPPEVEPLATEDWDFLDEAAARRADPTGGDVVADPVHEPLASDDAGAPREAVSTDDAGLPRAYSIQLASFSDRDNADRLRARLLDAGHEAYVTPTDIDGARWYPVFVGPRLDRAEAERLRDELAARFDLEPGQVVRFSLRTGTGRAGAG